MHFLGHTLGDGPLVRAARSQGAHVRPTLSVSMPGTYGAIATCLVLVDETEGRGEEGEETERGDAREGRHCCYSYNWM